MRTLTLAAALGQSAATVDVTARAPGSPAVSDPRRRTYDPGLDDVVARLIQDDRIADVNTALASWRRNDDPLPADVPADLAEHLRRASELPVWADTALLAHASALSQRHAPLLLLVYGLGGGILAAVTPRAARSVYWSAPGPDARERAGKTLTFGRDLCTGDPFGPAGSFIVTATKTRMVHAAVRHLLPQSPFWRASSPDDRPISNHDLLVAFHSTGTLAHRKLREWGVPLTARDEESLLHSWQVALHLLGVKDEFLPRTWEHAHAQSGEMLTAELDRTDEGQVLAERLLSLTADAGSGLSRGFLSEFVRHQFGNAIGDWLGLARDFESARVVRRGWVPYVATMGRESAARPAGAELFDRLVPALTAAFLDRAGTPREIALPDASRRR